MRGSVERERPGRPASATIIAAAVVAAPLLLTWAAQLRFAVAPVDPPRPVPDYGAQAAMAYAFLALAVVVGVVALTLAWRATAARARVVGWGSAAVVATGIGGALLAVVVASALAT